MDKSSVEGKLLTVVCPNNFLLKKEWNILRVKRGTVNDQARKTGGKQFGYGGKEIYVHSFLSNSDLGERALI